MLIASLAQDANARLISIVAKHISESTSPVTVIFKIPVPETAIIALLKISERISVILASCSRSLSVRFPGRVGWYLDDQIEWKLPEKIAVEVVYVGEPSEFGFRAARAAWRAGVRTYRSIGDDLRQPFRRRSMAGVMLRCLIRSIAYRLNLAWPRVVRAAPTEFRARWIAHKMKPLKWIREDTVPNRIILAIGGLGPGGSEQQAVHTLIALWKQGYSDLTLLHEQPLRHPNDFYLDRLRETNIVIDELVPLFLRAQLDWLGSPEVGKVMEAVGLNTSLGQHILSYYVEFLSRKPEIVHTWLDSVNVTAGIAAVLAGVPRVVIGCRSVAPNHFELFQSHMRPFYRFLAGCKNVFILNNSRAGAIDYSRWLNIPLEKFRVIYNAFDFLRVPDHATLASQARGFRLKWGVDDNERVVGTVIRLSEEKRPLLWVQTAEIVAANDRRVRFVIVGDGPQRSIIQKYIRQKKLDKRIIVMGYETDTISAIAAMDVFLLTSRMEGLPNVLIEAQAVGVPVVTADVGGTTETFLNGSTGIGVKQANARLLAAAVLRVLCDVQIRTSAHEKAPSLVREKFDVCKVLGDLLDCYGIDDRIGFNSIET